jgi:hypothetical protein
MIPQGNQPTVQEQNLQQSQTSDVDIIILPSDLVFSQEEVQPV